ncbi:type 1 glutamine amidotransferase domain-containing protein [Odoribacter laneus]|uniref:type 1 glutamine amidotransferase domain-containing protein n=1 Tax=Odoribacter laneus TaxID=626933 RepID=UPI003AB857C8
MDILHILLVVTGTGKYPNIDLKTGLWLSEFTHIYHGAKEKGYSITVASPQGGGIPIDPVSLKPIYLDKLSRNYWNDPKFRDMLCHTKSLKEVSGQLFDFVYLAGGHGSMFDFPDNLALQTLIKNHYEDNKKVGAICHGVCGLLHVKLSSGQYLIKGKKLTGFSWVEEILAERSKVVPFNLEAALKERGSDYSKSLIPMIPKVVVDGNLITGQDPFSSKKMAEIVLRQMAGNQKD